MDVKTAGKRLLATPTIWKATKPLRTSGCIVLTYHRIGGPTERFSHVPAHEFRAQMAWLRHHCDVMRPDELRERIARPSDGRRPSVLVTFDDGYSDYLLHAYPALKEFGVPAVNFLPTRYIDTGEPFWWDLVDLAVASSEQREARAPGAEAVTLDTPARRQAFGRRWKAALKQTAQPDRSPLLDDLFSTLGVARKSLRLPRQVMTWDEVRAVSDLTTFGGHTHNHPIMSLLDMSGLADEVHTCRDRIEAEIGTRPILFAYPSGASSDPAKAAVARGGFSAAFTTTEGVNAGGVDWMALRRVHGPQRAVDLPMLMTGWKHRN